MRVDKCAEECRENEREPLARQEDRGKGWNTALKIFKIYWSTDDIKNLKTLRLTCYHIKLTEFNLDWERVFRPSPTPSY